MAQGMELLDNGTKVFTGPGAAFGTDALLLARFAMPRRKETALDLCSGCGIVALAWHDAGHRGPCTAVELDADASALCRVLCRKRRVQSILPLFAPTCGRSAKAARNRGNMTSPPATRPILPADMSARMPAAPRPGMTAAARCRMLPLVRPRALHDGGKLALCHRPEQMAAVFAALCAVGLEPKRVALVRKDEHSKPWLFLVEAQKGRKPGIRWEEDVLTGNGVRYGR